MQIKNTLTRYGLVAIFLHWVMAMLIIVLLLLGLYMKGLPITLGKLKLYGWHKEFGILVLMLAIVRITWRLTHLTPLFSFQLAYWQATAAKSVHFIFYICMLIMPLSGWLISSAAGVSVSFFGWFLLPNLIAPNEQLQLFFSFVHQWLAYALIGLICAHTSAALLHHFIYKDDILRRMLP